MASDALVNMIGVESLAHLAMEFAFPCRVQTGPRWVFVREHDMPPGTLLAFEGKEYIGHFSVAGHGPPVRPWLRVSCVPGCCSALEYYTVYAPIGPVDLVAEWKAAGILMDDRPD